MKDFSLDFDPTTESYTDMSLDSILSQYKLESEPDDLSGENGSGYSPLYDDDDDDVRVYTPGAATARSDEPEDAEDAYGGYDSYSDDGYDDDSYGAQDYG